MGSLKQQTNTRYGVWLRSIAVLEILAGVMGVLSLPVYLHMPPGVMHPLFLLLLLITIANLLAGILLWRLRLSGLLFSTLIQLLQVPYYRSEGFPYQHVGFNFVVKAGWVAREGYGAYELGINLIAVILLLILLAVLSVELADESNEMSQG